jgi:hypothetical protein
MKKQFQTIVTCIFVFACVSHLIGQVVPSAELDSDTKYADTSVDGWVQENYSRVLDVLFRYSCDMPKGVNEMKWTICARIIPGNPMESESSLLFGKGYTGEIIARITRSRSRSVYVQLSELKREYPTATLANLSKLVMLESKEANGKELPLLLQISNDFERIRLSPIPSDSIYIDATSYTIYLKSYSGKKVEFLLDGPGSSIVQQPNSLLQVVEMLRQVLEKRVARP